MRAAKLIHIPSFSTSEIPFTVSNPLLRTTRTALSPFPLQKLERFYAINTDPFVRQYLWDNEIISRDLAISILEQNRDYFEDRAYGLWEIVELEHGGTIGYAGLWYFFDEPQPQLIYALLPAYTGRGLATEAASAIIDYAFSTLDFSYLIAATDAPHLSSQGVALRLGMEEVKRAVMEGKETVFFRLERPALHQI